jgi:quinol-cytochrome oxidoreductase complex cytochrome b subunit
MSGLGAPSAEVGASARARQRWRSLLLGALAALALLLVVLVLTGIALTTSYHPVAPGADGSTGVAVDVHRLAATLAQSVVLVAVVAALGWSYQVGRRAWPGPAVVLALVLVASFTGNLLPYEQLALWAVTTGDSIQGVWLAAFDDRVRFVLVGGVEVSQATYQRWFLAHLGLAAAAAVALVVVVRSVLRARPATDA